MDGQSLCQPLPCRSRLVLWLSGSRYCCLCRDLSWNQKRIAALLAMGSGPLLVPVPELEQTLSIFLLSFEQGLPPWSERCVTSSKNSRELGGAAV